MQEIYLQIVDGLRDYFGKAGFKKAVVGLSGGIDSSLTLKLTVDAIGADNVTGLLMPDLGLTNRINIEHAQKLADFFGVETYKVPINGFLGRFEELPWTALGDEYRSGLDLAEANTKARIRAVILYHYANSARALVMGTSNLSETLLGYGTKFGDLAADVEVIGALYKTEVREMARFLSLPPEIIDKKPSAELFKDQTDEGELGADYDVLDKILVNREVGVLKLVDQGFDENLVKSVFERVKNNQHKSEMPFVIEIER